MFFSYVLCDHGIFIAFLAIFLDRTLCECVGYARATDLGERMRIGADAHIGWVCVD